MFESLFKAAVGVVVELPVSVVADVATLGGSMTDKDRPHTISTLEKIVDNIGDSTEPR